MAKKRKYIRIPKHTRKASAGRKKTTVRAHIRRTSMPKRKRRK